jgi:aminoglycoside phosphotransferase (APT) family kinase protein
MTFKADWEKAHDQHNLDHSIIRKMLMIAYPGKVVNHYDIIAGGCANINMKVDIAGQDSPTMIRVYLRDATAAYREQKIGQLLSGKVPLPQIYHIAETCGYTFAVAEFMAGDTLRDHLLHDKALDIAEIMFKVGDTLAHIADTPFKSSGFFNEHLDISEPITQNGTIQFCQAALNDQTVKAVLSKKQREIIDELMQKQGSLLPDGHEKNLVHADFDPANILVQKKHGRLQISGILDWEFSFSGSTLCDVANMLRYAHHMPKCYEEAFLKGLSSGGYHLADNWRAKISMLNLLSLLDCLKRSDPENRPNQISDIHKLIEHILNVLT